MSDVASFLAELQHPHKAVAEKFRALVLELDPDIQEGIKWNSMSFRRGEWFATFQWRYRAGAQFVLHLGAKAREDSGLQKLPDPAGLLEWRGHDRALLTIRNADHFEAGKDAIRSILAEWITHV